MNERRNPYVGPRAFRTGEKLFGRGRETAELVDLLIAERIVLMSSPSGAGKSSLINAGLIPIMRESGFKVFPPVRVNLVLPRDITVPAGTNRFLFSLMLSLEESQPPEQRLSLDLLTRMKLEDYLNRLKATDDSFLLVFDQFEEILTIDPNQRVPKQEFFDQLGRALRDRERWALFAMREEYVAAVLPYARSIPTRLATTFRLDLLSRQAAIEAICEPARQAGIEFESAAAEELQRFLSLVRVQQPDGTTIEETGEFAEPVQLQVVCRRLWETLPPAAAKIGIDQVRNLGQVERALAEYYENVVAAAARRSEISERTIREWIENALITPTGIRGEAMQMPKSSVGLDNAAIALLVDGYLVREDKRRGNTWYELAHDRLIEVVKSSNALWFEKNLHPMQRQADLWEREGRPDRLLLGGRDLKVAESWAAANNPLIMKGEMDFLERSAGKRRSDRVKLGTLVAGVAGLLALAAFSLVQWRIAVEQTHAALLRQSRLLSELAVREAEAGDIVTAELLALSGLPDYQLTSRVATAAGDRPYLPELEARLYENYLKFRERAVLSNHKGSVLSVAFSPDGSRIVTGSAEQSAQVWDAASGKMLRELAGHNGPVRSVAFTADGNQIVTGSDDHIVRMFDAQTGDPIIKFDSGAGVLSIAVSADGNRFVAGSEDGSARVWDRITKERVTLLSGKHSGPVNSVAISADGAVVVTGSGDATAIVWDVANSKPVRIVSAELSISSVALSVDAKHLVTGSSDRTVRVWQVATEQPPLAEWTGPDEVSSVTFDVAGTRIVSGSRDGAIRLWDWSTKEEPDRLVGHAAGITSVGIGADGTSLVSGSDDGTARIWSTRPIAGRMPLSHRGHVSAVGVTPDGSRIVTGSRDKTARLWDGSSGKELVVGSEVSGVAISRDASRIVTGSQDGVVRVWGADLTKGPRELAAHNVPISCVALSPDARKVAAGFQDGTARIWDAESGAPVAELKPHPGRVTSIAFGPGGDWVATGTGTSVRIWDLATPNPVPVVHPDHVGSVLAVAISRDGRLVASGGREEGIRVLRRSGPQEETFILRGSRDTITSLAFTDDGVRIVAGSADGKLHVWDVERRELIGAVKIHSAVISSVAIAAQDTLVVTGSTDNTARLSKFFGSTGMLVDAAKKTVPRCLTPQQMKRFVVSSIPPRWCITGSGREHEPDSSRWQPRWPYDRQEWRQWLVASDRGERVKPPDM
jgi:WD40 repeat protein